jgi:uncharacterized lipoprotein YajG
MMSNRVKKVKSNVAALVVALLVTSVVLASCGAQGNSLNGAHPKALFCKNVAALSAGLSSSSNPSSGLAYVEAHKKKVDQLATEAPSAIASAAQSLVKVINAAMAANSYEMLSAKAGQHASNAIKSFCGSSG